MRNILLPIGNVFKKIMKSIPAIVVEVEKAMKDGKIDQFERKALATKTVEAIAEQFDIKLGWLAMWVIGQAIDFFAKKLPSKSISVPDIILKITKEF